MSASRSRAKQNENRSYLTIAVALVLLVVVVLIIRAIQQPAGGIARGELSQAQSQQLNTVGFYCPPKADAYVHQYDYHPANRIQLTGAVIDSFQWGMCLPQNRPSEFENNFVGLVESFAQHLKQDERNAPQDSTSYNAYFMAQFQMFIQNNWPAIQGFIIPNSDVIARFHFVDRPPGSTIPPPPSASPVYGPQVY